MDYLLKFNQKYQSYEILRQPHADVRTTVSKITYFPNSNMNLEDDLFDR